MNKFAILIIFLIVILVNGSLFAQNYTTSGTGNGNWSDGNSWSPFISGGPTSADGTITIAHNLAVDVNVTVDELTINLSRTLTVNSGISLTLNNGTGNDLTFATGFGTAIMDVNGRIIVTEGAVISNSSSSRLRILSSGIYEHNYSTTAGVIYTAGWSTGSGLEITGYTTPGGPPTGLGQNFENFTWNCPSQGEFIDLNGVLQTVNGDLNISETNGNFLVLTQGAGYTLSVGGDFNVSGNTALALNGFTSAVSTTVNVTGDFNYTSSSESWLALDGDAVINVTGNTVVNSSVGIDLVNNSGTGTGSIILNLSGNFTLTAGELKNTTGASVCDIDFSGTTDSQIFSNSGTINESVNFTVSNGAFVDFGTSSVTGSGQFTLESGGTIKVGSTDGLTTGTVAGNIRVSGTRTYNANGSIIYNGSSSQNLGNEWGGSGALNGVAVNLEIDNNNGTGVTNNIIGSTSLVGVLTLTSGSLNIGVSNTLDVQGDFNVTGGTIGGESSSNLTFSNSGILGTLSFTSGSQNLASLTNSRISTALALGSDLTIASTLSLTSNLDLSGQSLTFNGTSITGGAGLIGNSTSNLTIGGSGFSGSIPFTGSSQLNDLSLSSGGGAAYTINSAVTVNNNLNMNAGTLTHTSGLTMATNSTFVKDAGSIISNSPNAASSYNVLYTSPGTTSLELPSSTTALNDLTVTVSGTVAFQSGTTVNGSLVLNSGTLDASTNNLEVAGSNWTANGGTFTINSANTVTLSNAGTITVGGSSIGGTQFGNLTINSGTTVSAPNANLNVSGTWNNLGIFTPNSGTITFNGASQNIDPNAQPFNNVDFAGTGTKTLQGALDVNGSLTINSTLDVGSNQSINVAGTWNNSGIFTAGGGTVTFDGASQTITSAGDPFFNLTLSNSGTKTLGDALDANGVITIDNGVTLDVSVTAYDVNLAGGWTNNGTFNERTGTMIFDGTTAIAGSSTTDFFDVTIAGTLTATSATTNVAGNWLYSSGTFNNNGGTINFNSGSNKNITPGGQPFNNVTISNLNTKTLLGDIDINGNLTLSGGTFSVGTDRTINVAGNWDASGGGIFTAAAGNVIFDGVTQNVNGGSETFNNIELASTTTATFSGDLSLTGNWNAIAGSSYSASGLTSFTGTGAQSITSNGGSFGALTIAGSSSKTIQDALDVNGDLTISSTLVGTNQTITTSGNWDAGSGTFTSTNSNVTLDGAGQNLTTGSNSFNNITIAGTGSKTLQDAFDVNGDLIISSTLDVGSNQNITLVGDWTNNGAFTAGTGIVTLDGSAAQSIAGSSATTFNDLTISNTASTATINTAGSGITGTLTLNASSGFNANGNLTLVSDASGTARVASIPGTATFSGNVIYQRYITGAQQWHNIGMPVSGLVTDITGSGFTVNGNDLGRYNESVAGDLNQGWETSDLPFTAIDDTQGYSLWTRTADIPGTLNFTGSINTGNMSLPVTFTSNDILANDGWNLVNNPYASQIDWTSGSWTKTNIDATIYVWNPGTGSYISGATTIASGQSFWVHANAASPVLTAVQNVKTSASATFYRIAPPPVIDELLITLTGGGSSDLTKIIFKDGATEEFDSEYDGYKLQNAIFNFSSITEAGLDLSINTIPLIDCNRLVKLNITNINEGAYQLKFDGLITFEEAFEFTLRDNFLNTTTIFDEGTLYDFVVTTDPASFGNTRFEIELNAIALASTISYELADECDFSSSITIIDPLVGTNYTLVQAGVDIVTRKAADEPLVLPLTEDQVIEGINQFDIKISNGSCGEVSISNAVEFTINPIDAGELEYEAEIGCELTTDLTILNAQIGVSYTVVQNEIDIFTIVATENQLIIPLTQDYVIEGINEFDLKLSNGSCPSAFLPKAIVFTTYALQEIVSTTNGESCESGQVLLSATGATGNAFYNWYESSDAIDPIPSETGSDFLTPILDISKYYFVTIVNEAGCESLERIKVKAEIKKLPNTDILYQVTDLCDLSSNLVITNAQIGATYTLVQGAQVVVSVIATELNLTLPLNEQQVSEGSNVFDLMIEMDNCSVEIVDAIELTYSPRKEITQVQNGKKCTAGRVGLLVEGATGNEYYRWYESVDGTEPIPNQISNEYLTPILDVSKSYYVSIVNESGCESLARTEVFAEIVNLNSPDIQFSEDQGVVSTSIIAESYVWYKDDIVIEGETSQTLEVFESGIYHVTIASNGCSSTSENIAVEILGFSELERLGISVYPNPVVDMLNIESLTKINSINIFDIKGVAVYRSGKNVSDKINMTSIKKGIYIINIVTNNKTINYRIKKK
jgi:Ig-like domain-containing protein/type IX secretion system substrate protein